MRIFTKARTLHDLASLGNQLPKPSMSVLPSREYAERLEGAAILAILEAILAEVP